MIRKQDILDRATEWRLRPDVVEKDYVLGWLLTALALHPTAGRLWVLKGGTSIKKCYFETYRFSEDVDLSLLPGAPYAQGDIRTVLQEIARTAAELSGAQFPEDRIEVRSGRDKLGRSTFQGRVSYRGPLSTPSFPRVLFDITRHEPVLDPPSPQPLFHPYPDAPGIGTPVLVYSLNELLAEKTRALYERTRPRDLYDVVYLLENQPEAFDLVHVRELFQQKCRAKNIPVPSARRVLEVVQEAEELRTEWANMLAYQLLNLPHLDGMLLRLPGLLGWIDAPAVVMPEAMLAAAPIPSGTIPVVSAGIRYWGTGLPLEAIRFAGANRLLIEFDYDGTRCVVEPYSLRRASTGNLFLYAWEQGGTHIEAFNLTKMLNVRPTDVAFTPRYRIEFMPHGPLAAPSASAPERSQPVVSPRRLASASRHRSPHGPWYVFRCSYCQREFRHSQNDPTLRKHTAAGGRDCPGRHGHLVRVT